MANTITICIGCGCDDLHACVSEDTDAPCHWLAVDYIAGVGVCANCPDHLARWNAGDRGPTATSGTGNDAVATGLKVVWGRQQAAEELRRLIGEIEGGEIGTAAIRVFKADGTWEALVLGAGMDEE